MILSLGELLVEVMRDSRGIPLDRPGSLWGPLASGAPAIFAGMAARLGANVRFVGVVGDDAFGKTCMTHLHTLGVEAHVRTVSDYTTGTAFVSYDQEGGREFVFHLPHAAAALLEPADLTPPLLSDVTWLHITGSSLAISKSMRQSCYEAVRLAKAKGATVSFDPNIRLEMMSPNEIGEMCGPILALADVVLPSAHEAIYLVSTHDETQACHKLLDAGAKAVILKKGSEGSTLFTPQDTASFMSIPVEEIDPTGAGDCFAAALAVARLEGMTWPKAIRFASVVGALSVTAFGPMQGLPTRTMVETYL